MKTSELFKKEINYIHNEDLKEIVKNCLDEAPEHFQHISASQTGKYHPAYSLGDGGLVRHTKAAVGIAYDLAQSNCLRDICLGIHAEKDSIELMEDVIFASLILHDTRKPDDNGFHSEEYALHPYCAAAFFVQSALLYKSEKYKEYDYENYEDYVKDTAYLKAVIPLIESAIQSHMGKWNTCYYAPEVVLPEPRTGLDVFVHMCDYLASRKELIYDFDIAEGRK